MNWRFRTNWGDEVCVSDSKLGDKIFKVGEDFSDFWFGEKMELLHMNWQL